MWAACRRNLAGEAASAQVPVAADGNQGECSECDEVPILDPADVIAPHHQQQESGDEDADPMPQSRSVPAPAPLGGRHVLDIDPCTSLHFGAGHADILTQRNLAATGPRGVLSAT